MCRYKKGIKDPKNLQSYVQLAAKQSSGNQYSKILNELKNAGVISTTGNKSVYKYNSDEIKTLLRKGGAVLELHTYYSEKEKYDDALVSVHLDWDGVTHHRNTDMYGNGRAYADDEAEVDVNNEVDVLLLKGYVPTFISCKSGSLEGTTALRALYELETVASRFGGKFAKKVLATMQPLKSVAQERAKALGIEVWDMKNDVRGE
jgi:hypothetical protein